MFGHLNERAVCVSFNMQQTFHTPSLGDEVFEIPPISLDPDQALSIGDAVSHFELTDGADGAGASSGSRSFVSNLVVETNDPSFASTFVNSGSQGLEQLGMGTMSQAGGGALLSSSALVSKSDLRTLTSDSFCWMMSEGTPHLV